jgi:hypothetical protein
LYVLSNSGQYQIGFLGKGISSFKGISEYLYYQQAKEMQNINIKITNVSPPRDEGNKNFKEKFTNIKFTYSNLILKNKVNLQDAGFWMGDQYQKDKN